MKTNIDIKIHGKILKKEYEFLVNEPKLLH